MQLPSVQLPQAFYGINVDVKNDRKEAFHE
jgi:hypothetical protein